jgi:hypothetical protein
MRQAANAPDVRVRADPINYSPSGGKLASIVEVSSVFILSIARMASGRLGSSSTI